MKRKKTNKKRFDFIKKNWFKVKKGEKLMFKRISILFLPLFLSSCYLNLPIPKGDEVKSFKQDVILLLRIENVINNEFSQSFMKNVRKYAGKEHVRGVLIRVNSGGGAIGASEEINQTIKEIRQIHKKPVYVSCGDVSASGAILSTASADKIFVNAGTMYGSIGVVSTIQDISELMRWAKIDMYNITAGEFKDTGSPFRKMTVRERELLEGLLETAHNQFKQVIADGRKLTPQAIEVFADGRLFTGKDAVDYGLADEIGSLNKVIEELAKKTGLGKEPKLFDPTDKSPAEKFFERWSGSILKNL